MKKTIMLITLFIILISCQAKTGPIATEGTPQNSLKSVGPVLGESYLWITITPGATSTVRIEFGTATGPSGTVGETITFEENNIEDISPAKDENNSSYAFQTGTITGSLEILDTKRAKISFTQNVSPYVKIMEVICETPII